MPAAKPHDPTEISTANLARYFSDEAEAWLLVERLRWPEGKPVCPHCGVIGNAYYLEPKAGKRTTRTGSVSYRRLWKCGECRQQFSALVGTIFEDSKVPLYKWLLAVHHMCAGKNGISAHELHRTLGVTYKTAWFMAHRIRYAMAQTGGAPFTGIVEADETYVGGVAKGKRGRGAEGKTPVFALVQRGGNVHAEVMPTVTGKNVGRVLRERTVPASTVLVTDTLNVYTTPGRAMGWHETVNHSEGEYVRGAAHTNTIEGYFGQLKRSIDGTYHHVSPQHLHRYLAEFTFRYNARKVKDGQRTELAFGRVAGKRLTYRDSSSAGA